MLKFPNAKINLGLRILDKRPDGFHNIESIFYPVNYCDALEIIPSDKFSFKSNQEKFLQNIQDNLCVKAYELLRVDFELPPVNFFLFKKIPIGAGLGGGSADAAVTLKMLNEIFNLKLTDDKLENYAAQLGSDCVFFIKNKPALVTGRGENLQPIQFNLQPYAIAIITPDIGVNTMQAYNLWDELMGQTKPQRKISLTELTHLPVNRWKESLENDFEAIIFNEFPALKSLKETLYESGAIYASLSGSGSALYGIFKKSDLDYFKNSFDKSNLKVNIFIVNN